ncbi:hypothetical protein K8I61_17205 [bacterium]|nr:hypothetical protein [bacterium]
MKKRAPSKGKSRELVGFASKIRLKNGRILYAWQYGIRGFPIYRNK